MARVLLADDDPDYARSFSAGIKALGHEVVVETTGEKAIARLDRETDGFDLIFLDVMMPDGGAATVVHRLPDVCRNTPVVILTGRAEIYDSPLFREGFRYAAARLHKSVSLDEFESLINRLLSA